MTFSKALLQQMYTTFAYYLPNMKNRHKTTFIYCSQMYIWSDISKSHLMLKSWDLQFFCQYLFTKYICSGIHITHCIMSTSIQKFPVLFWLARNLSAKAAKKQTFSGASASTFSM